MSRNIFDAFASRGNKKKVSEFINEHLVKNKGKLNMREVIKDYGKKKDYNEIMEERIAEYKKKMLEEAGENLSDKAKAAIQEMAEIKAKKDMKWKKIKEKGMEDLSGPGDKKKKSPVNFLAGSFGGGVGADADYDWQAERKRRDEEDRRRRMEDDRRRRAEEDRRRREDGGW